MTITIVATFECATIDEFNECMAIVRDNEPSSITFAGSYTFIPPGEDLTPPQGLSRADVDHAISVHISALVAWTIENITSGPVTEVPRQVLREAFRCILDEGDDAYLDDLMTPTQASCVRGAFRDAQGGMVPL